MVRTDYFVARWFIAVGLRYPYGETGRNGGIGGSANPEQHDALRSAEMLCAIIVKPGYLKVDLFNQQTAAETRDALGTIAAEARKRKSSQILISVHASRPIFKVEQYGLPEYFKELGESKRRIALKIGRAHV